METLEMKTVITGLLKDGPMTIRQLTDAIYYDKPYNYRIEQQCKIRHHIAALEKHGVVKGEGRRGRGRGNHPITWRLT